MISISIERMEIDKVIKATVLIPLLFLVAHKVIEATSADALEDSALKNISTNLDEGLNVTEEGWDLMQDVEDATDIVKELPQQQPD